VRESVYDATSKIISAIFGFAVPRLFFSTYVPLFPVVDVSKQQ
jgi:hypothetical protein